MATLSTGSAHTPLLGSRTLSLSILDCSYCGGGGGEPCGERGPGPQERDAPPGLQAQPVRPPSHAGQPHVLYCSVRKQMV